MTKKVYAHPSLRAKISYNLKMKLFSNYEPMSKEYFGIWTKRFEKVTPDYEGHPREDYHMISEKFPIAVVADGVTLKRDSDGNYPVTSGAGQLAKLLCEAIIREAEGAYENFQESDLQKIFAKANMVAKEFNDSHGRFKDAIDYRDFDLFAATASFVLVKDEKIYWWSICDSGVVIYDNVGNELMRSPETWTERRRALVKPESVTETEWNILIKKEYRNAAGNDGVLSGYGVLTGEDGAHGYLCAGSYEAKEVNVILLYTDGYINYLALQEFIGLFNKWPERLEEKVTEFSKMRIEKEPAIYGQERSLVAIKI